MGADGGINATTAAYNVVPLYPTFQPWLFLLQLVIMAWLGRAISYGFYRLKLPRIVGDMLAGLILGPTVMGVGGDNEMFQVPERATIKMLGNIGLMLTCLGAGANFDARVIGGEAQKARK